MDWWMEEVDDDPASREELLILILKGDTSVRLEGKKRRGGWGNLSLAHSSIIAMVIRLELVALDL
jgi:hypothetical protein